MSKRLLIVFILTLVMCMSMLAFAQDPHEHDDGHDHAAEDPAEHAGEPGAAGEEHGGHDEHGSEFVQLSPKDMQDFGVVVDTAGPGVIRNQIVVPGEVAVNGDRIAHIVPRFTGVVKEVRKQIGDRVHTGDVLAVVESNEGLTPYNVTALMDGTVIDKQINIGEVSQGNEPAFIIADLDTVWINLSLYQMHLGSVRVGQAAAITADHGIGYEHGTVSYIAPIVDEHTRTATARVVLPNPSGYWRPGLLVEGRITTDSYAADIAVPKTAIFHMDGSDVVFVWSPEGFHAQPVELGRSNHSNVEIIKGLQPGQVYAVRGGFTIKAEMQKGSFGEGHAH
ncbi:MAG: efflux RND transporter periplasmic adaptor subunit [Candidatus Zixiibacteriota bacterium]